MQNKKNMFFLGLFFFLGLVSILSWTIFLTPNSGDNKKILRVWSVDIQGIMPGAQVMLAGKKIGKVCKINNLLDSQNELERDGVGRYYAYELILKVDSLTKVFKEDVIMISSSGLIGDRIVNIIPKGIRQDNNEISEKILFASSESLFQEAIEISTQVKNMLNKFSCEMESCSHSLKIVLSTIDDLGKELKDTNLFSNFSETNILLNQNLFELSKLLKENNGTIQQLIQDSSSLVSDIRNYGLLFQYNRSWKKKEKKLVLQEKTFLNESLQ